jgi:hypothetical protein
LARTVYVHLIWPYIRWFSCLQAGKEPNIRCTNLYAHIWFIYTVLANPMYAPRRLLRTKTHV